MSLSLKQRRENAIVALRMIMENLDETPYEWQEHDATDVRYLAIQRTTWAELVRSGYVRASTFDRYLLTGSGWIAGLKSTGQFADPEFRNKAGRLCAALKLRVKGRRQMGDADRTELATETGLSEHWIYNAIDSHLIAEMFDRKDACWAADDQMKTAIDIPIDFGYRIERP